MASLEHQYQGRPEVIRCNKPPTCFIYRESTARWRVSSVCTCANPLLKECLSVLSKVESRAVCTKRAIHRCTTHTIKFSELRSEQFNVLWLHEKLRGPSLQDLMDEPWLRRAGIIPRLVPRRRAGYPEPTLRSVSDYLCSG